MLSCLVVLALGAAPSPVKLGTVPFGHAGITPETANLLQDGLTNRLASRPGLEVITPSDIAATLGLERQKQLLGCADAASSCITELAGALGVDGLITGTVGRVGQSFVLNVKVVSARDARQLFTYASRALPTEEALLEEAATVADLLVARLAPPVASAAAVAPWLLMGSGALVAAGGGVFAGLTLSRVNALEGEPSLPAGQSPEAVRDAGKLYQGLGIGLLAGGGALMLTGLIWRIAAPTAKVATQLSVGPGHVVASLQVPFP